MQRNGVLFSKDEQRSYFLSVTWDAMKTGTLSAITTMTASHKTSERLRFIGY